MVFVNFATHKTKLILTFPNNPRISNLKQIPFGRSLTVENELDNTKT